MACVPIVDEKRRYFVFACNTSDVAFGPLMFVPKECGKTVEEVAEDFVEFLCDDPRTFSEGNLCDEWTMFYNSNLSEESRKIGGQ